MITITQTLTTKSGLTVPTGSKLKVVQFFLDRTAGDAAENSCAFAVRLFKDTPAVDVEDFIHVKEFDNAHKYLLSEVGTILNTAAKQLDIAEAVVGKYLTDKSITFTTS
jgi:hypothetical protein